MTSAKGNLSPTEFSSLWGSAVVFLLDRLVSNQRAGLDQVVTGLSDTCIIKESSRDQQDEKLDGFSSKWSTPCLAVGTRDLNSCITSLKCRPGSDLSFSVKVAFPTKILQGA